MEQLVASGLDHIQLSFQDSREEVAAGISGVRAHTRKIDAARWIREHALAFTVNIVVHRQNLDHLEEIISFGRATPTGSHGDRSCPVLWMGTKESRRLDADANPG
jgi:pyrroloquinoline quinone biosynthesis protein E